MKYNMKKALQYARELEEYPLEEKYQIFEPDEVHEELLYLAKLFVDCAKRVADKDLQKLLKAIRFSSPEKTDGHKLYAELMHSVEALKEMEIEDVGENEIEPLSDNEQFFYEQILLRNIDGKGISAKSLLDCWDPENDEVYNENTLKSLLKRLIAKRGIRWIRGIGHFDPRVLPLEDQTPKKKRPKKKKKAK